MKTTPATYQRFPAFLILVPSLLCLNLSSAKPESGIESGNPVIFIPGVMGSRLVDQTTNQVIWGEFSGRGPRRKIEVVSRGMALPMVPGKRLDQIHDSVVEDGVLRDFHLRILPGVNVNPSFYRGLLDRISGNEVTGEKNKDQIGQPKVKRVCLEFPYDWRRSTDENSKRLASFIETNKRTIEDSRRSKGNHKPVRFDMIAHSQGVVVARYFLRHGAQQLERNGALPLTNWSGARDIDSVILLGAPNGGIALTLKYLTHGRRVNPLLPHFEASVLGTMPAIYQLLPRASDRVLIEKKTGEFLDPLDFNLWVEKEWGLANPNQDRELVRMLPHIRSREERRAIALDHLQKCLRLARKFQVTMDRPASRPRHLRVVLCACDSKKTPARFAACRHKVRINLRLPGDGTVPLYSATRCPSHGESKEGWEFARLFEADHTALATDPEVSGFFLHALSSR